MSDFPACFDWEWQFLKWQRAAHLAIPRRGAISPRLASTTYCTDCTSEYQDDMKEQGRCAYPETKFWLVLDEDELEIIGVRP